eukprot:16439185-Heterocapsa_arctica.AAC.1
MAPAGYSETDGIVIPSAARIDIAGLASPVEFGIIFPGIFCGPRIGAMVSSGEFAPVGIGEPLVRSLGLR